MRGRRCATFEVRCPNARLPLSGRELLVLACKQCWRAKRFSLFGVGNNKLLRAKVGRTCQPRRGPGAAAVRRRRSGKAAGGCGSRGEERGRPAAEAVGCKRSAPGGEPERPQRLCRGASAFVSARSRGCGGGGVCREVPKQQLAAARACGQRSLPLAVWEVALDALFSG